MAGCGYGGYCFPKDIDAFIHIAGKLGYKFDLLKAQYDAAKEIGVNVPVYLSAGIDNVASYDHPEWREIRANGQLGGGEPEEITNPGFHSMCFNSPYMDYLCEQIKEAVELFPECDGIF